MLMESVHSMTFEEIALLVKQGGCRILCETAEEKYNAECLLSDELNLPAEWSNNMSFPAVGIDGGHICGWRHDKDACEIPFKIMIAAYEAREEEAPVDIRDLI